MGKKLDYSWTIKDLPLEMRPREKLASFGSAALSDGELLAILLVTGRREESSLDLAHRILANPRGLKFLTEATIEELAEIKGIGLAKAAQLKAAAELGRRLVGVGGEQFQVIKSPEDVSRLVMAEMANLDREHFRCILLNTKNGVIGVETISVGSLNASLVHPREVFKNAVKRSAAAVILTHNHPSGDPTPSKEDIEITRRLVEAGKILGIDVLDHVIIGNHRYVSLKEKGLF